MEDKQATHLPSSSPPSPYFLPPPSTADVIALELVPTSKRNSSGSDKTLLIQSLTEHLQNPKAKTLAQPGHTEEFDARNLRSSPLSLHVRAHTQTPSISTTTSSRSKASTDSNLSEAVDKEPAVLPSSTALFSNTDIKVRDFITYPVLTAVDVPQETVSPLSEAPDTFVSSEKETQLFFVTSPEPQAIDNVADIQHNGPLTTSSSRRSSLDSVRSIKPIFISQGLGSVHRRISDSSIKSASSKKYLSLPRYLGSYHGSSTYSRLTRAVSSPAVVSNRGTHPPRKSCSLSRIAEGHLRASSPLLIDIKGPIDSEIQFPGHHLHEVVPASSDPPHLRKTPLFVPRRIQRRHSVMNSSMEATASGQSIPEADLVSVGDFLLEDNRSYPSPGNLPTPAPTPPPAPSGPRPPPSSRLRRVLRAVKRFFRHL